ncbi:MAG: ABC transporter permease [Bacteroidales bacterium]|nr:ABC transporter permease [Bacteroidales bacterium]MDD6140784.1 ABC transporter permease [Bacteroidales bacterium]MDD6621385.1 ABC transporter permease [Bacteroidales bacterium]MDD6668703.1 ABC transporter permease [Bacteroidales bacterium]
MSNKIWLVVQREFATRARKKSFIIMTILMPFLMAGLIFLPLLLSLIKDSEQRTVAVVDNSGLYSSAIKSNEQYLFVPTENMTPDMRSDSTDVYAVVNITGDLVEHPTKAAIYSRQEVPSDLRDYVNSALTEAVRQEKFRRYNIPELNNIIDDIQQTVDVATVRWTDEGEQESLTDVATLVGMILTFLIYMFVLSYGAMVMQSVIEEKTNRIVEVMVSSIKPLQLLFGKIIGVGLVGLFQMLIWGLLLSSIVGIITAVTGIDVGADPATAAAATDDGAMELFNQLATLPIAEIVILFVLYFIGGYLLYASMLAAFGAAVNDQQDSGQFMMPVMLVMVFAFYAGFYGAQNPEGPLAFWTSFIPFTSSIVMMVRIPFGVPFYQIAISVATLYATVFAMLWVSAKIYRIGILIYGKKPSFKDFYKWLRY